MEKLISFADKLLSFIPFNGDKTVIGSGLKLIVPVLAGYFPALLVAAPYLDAFADFLITTGLFHKPIKVQAQKNILNNIIDSINKIEMR